MTELKTLKDFESNEPENESNCGYARAKDDLRQEAIKWIKELQIPEIDRMESRAVIQWIKHFFNITEEDLR